MSKEASILEAKIVKKMKTDLFGNKKIFLEFRRGVFYEDIYKKYEITQKDLINILQKNIKGNYDYQNVLSGGLDSQKQFIKHLGSRWNPLEPDVLPKSISPYVSLKERESDEEE